MVEVVAHLKIPFALSRARSRALSLRLKFPHYSCLWVKALKDPSLKAAIIIKMKMKIIIAITVVVNLY